MEYRDRLGLPTVVSTFVLRACGHPAADRDDAETDCPYCLDYAEALAQDILDECLP